MYTKYGKKMGLFLHAEYAGNTGCVFVEEKENNVVWTKITGCSQNKQEKRVGQDLNGYRKLQKTVENKFYVVRSMMANTDLL